MYSAHWTPIHGTPHTEYSKSTHSSSKVGETHQHKRRHSSNEGHSGCSYVQLSNASLCCVHVCTDPHEQVRLAERLLDIIVSPFLEAAEHLLACRVGRHHDDRQLITCTSCNVASFLQSLDIIHRWPGVGVLTWLHIHSVQLVKDAFGTAP
jgi:hypothetical protein